MDRTRLERIKDLLEQLISLPESGDEAARNAFLSRAGVDADIRSEVLRLLAADSRARGKTAGQSAEGQAATADSLQNLPVSDATSAPTVPPDQPAATSAAGGGGGGSGANRNAGGGSGGGRSTTPRTTSDSHDPEHIGPYRVLKRLGGGGMGVVYLCIRDDEQITRRVAVKLIKKGMDSEAVLKRFELEKQVLSNLSHPNIARVLDAGMSDDHRPYFVMDYVEGQTLLDYCDSNQLSIADRLKIFMKLCGAVHAAHQNLIVHRDIKPGNIIVGVDGEPKLLDFGIAKLLNPSNAGGAGIDIATLEFQRLMTPEYASPEQVKGDPVRTTSDIYSLGVLLYELLTGLRPYNFRSRLMDEIKRVICDEEPQRPSTAVAWDAAPTATQTTGMGTGTVDAGALKTRAKLRSTKPDTLKRELSNDLDDIVLMAMRKVPSRRYASAEQMAEDIRRHLTGQTVIARPETMGYVVGKFVRRNKVGVATVAAFVVVVAGAAIGMGFMWRREAVLRAATQEARAEAEKNQLVAQRALQQKLDAERDLDQERSKSANLIKDLRSMEASASLGVIGQQASLALLDRAVPVLLQSAGTEISRRVIAEHSLDYLTLLKDIEPKDKSTSEKLARAYEALYEATGGVTSSNLGQRQASFEAATRALALRLELAQQYPDEFAARDNVMWAQRYLGTAIALLGGKGWADRSRRAYEDAVDSGRRAITLAQVESEKEKARQGLAYAQHSLSSHLLSHGQPDRARQLAQEALDLLRRNLEANATPGRRRGVAIGLGYLAKNLVASKQPDEMAKALELYREALAIRRELSSENPTDIKFQRDVPVSQELVGKTLSALGRHTEAVAELRPALRAFRDFAEVAPDDARLKTDVARAWLALASSLFELPDASDALINAYDAKVAIDRLTDDLIKRELTLDWLVLATRFQARHPNLPIVVRSVRGKVQAKHSEESEWKVEDPGSLLPIETTLRVGIRSSVDLQVGLLKVTVVDRISQITVAQIVAGIGAPTTSYGQLARSSLQQLIAEDPTNSDFTSLFRTLESMPIAQW